MSGFDSKNFPTLCRIAKTQGVKRRAHIHDNYRTFECGIAPTELNRAEQAGLIANLIKAEVDDSDEHRLVGACEFEFTPKFVEVFLEENQQKPGPKTNATQITVNGRTRYMSDRARMILDAQPELLAETAYEDLNRMRNTRNKKLGRHLVAELHDIMLLRGKDLPKPLYGSLCLRLGTRLPEDFWHLPPEMLPKQASEEKQRQNQDT